MQRVGKYQLLRKLATGGMAEVFLARAEGPMGFQKRLVVKRILPHFIEDENFVGMFLAEAKLAAELDHPNLVQIFDFGEAEGQYYLAMEFIDGPNLRALNVAARAVDKPLPYALAARLMTSAAEGLHAAHELRDDRGQLVNLVHRDISPDNILIARNGTVKVVDFGIAKAAGRASETKQGIVKGKLAYMPPEQLAREPLDRRADIFALGVVLYELVAGAMPFDSTSEVSIIQAIMNDQPLQRAKVKNADVPVELDEIIAKCLAKNPADRYQTCKQLQNALEHFIASTGTPIFASDLAQMIDDVVPAITDDAVSSVAPAPKAPNSLTPLETELRRTVPERPKSGRRGAATRRVEAHAESEPEASVSGESQTLDQSPPLPSDGTGLTYTRPAVERQQGRSGQLVQVAVILLLLGFSGGALAVFRPWEGKVERVPLPATMKPAPTLPTPDPTPGSEVDSGVDDVVVPSNLPDAVTHDAGGHGSDTTDVAAPATDTAPTPGPVPPPAAGAAKTGHFELRIRPFATVFIDGKALGQTPLPPLTLTVGKHKLRLVNEELGKNIEQDIVVRPGENPPFKLNLKE